MRVACVSMSQVPSNTANSIQTVKVCHALSSSGAEVRLWVPGKPANQPWEQFSQFYGLATSQSQVQQPFKINWLKSRPGYHRLDLTLAALWAARRWRADVLYTWLIQAAVLALLCGIPVVYEMHDRPTGRFGAHWLRLFASMRGRKHVMMITRALRQKVADEFNIRFADEEVILSPNGVEVERYQDLPAPPLARQKLGLPEGITAVYTGHFYAGRGMDILWSLAQAYPSVNFLWVGGRAVDVALWQEKIQRAGVTNITLTGFVENQKLPLYQAAGDILLMPYERQISGSSGGNSADICSPMKMFEYMAAARAILSSDLPVIAEVLNPQNAAFAAAENVPAWIESFGNLLADAHLREALGRQARQDVLAFTWRARVERVLPWLQSNRRQ